MLEKLEASCMAAVVSVGHYKNCVLISYSGGNVGDWNVWEQEIDNSISIEDIFYTYEQPPDKHGFYVWEGEIEPVEDDQPIYYGKWRKATKEDMSNLITE